MQGLSGVVVEKAEVAKGWFQGAPQRWFQGSDPKGWFGNAEAKTWFAEPVPDLADTGDIAEVQQQNASLQRLLLEAQAQLQDLKGELETVQLRESNAVEAAAAAAGDEKKQQEQLKEASQAREEDRAKFEQELELLSTAHSMELIQLRNQLEAEQEAAASVVVFDLVLRRWRFVHVLRLIEVWKMGVHAIKEPDPLEEENGTPRLKTAASFMLNKIATEEAPGAEGEETSFATLDEATGKVAAADGEEASKQPVFKQAFSFMEVAEAAAAEAEAAAEEEPNPSAKQLQVQQGQAKHMKNLIRAALSMREGCSSILDLMQRKRQHEKQGRRLVIEVISAIVFSFKWERSAQLGVLRAWMNNMFACEQQALVVKAHQKMEQLAQNFDDRIQQEIATALENDKQERMSRLCDMGTQHPPGPWVLVDAMNKGMHALTGRVARGLLRVWLTNLQQHKHKGVVHLLQQGFNQTCNQAELRLVQCKRAKAQTEGELTTVKGQMRQRIAMLCIAYSWVCAWAEFAQNQAFAGWARYAYLSRIEKARKGTQRRIEVLEDKVDEGNEIEAKSQNQICELQSDIGNLQKRAQELETKLKKASDKKRLARLEATHQTALLSAAAPPATMLQNHWQLTKMYSFLKSFCEKMKLIDSDSLGDKIKEIEPSDPVLRQSTVVKSCADVESSDAELIEYIRRALQRVCQDTEVTHSRMKAQMAAPRAAGPSGALRPPKRAMTPPIKSHNTGKPLGMPEVAWMIETPVVKTSNERDQLGEALVQALGLPAAVSLVSELQARNGSPRRSGSPRNLGSPRNWGNQEQPAKHSTAIDGYEPRLARRMSVKGSVSIHHSAMGARPSTSPEGSGLGTRFGHLPTQVGGTRMQGNIPVMGESCQGTRRLLNSRGSSRGGHVGASKSPISPIVGSATVSIKGWDQD